MTKNTAVGFPQLLTQMKIMNRLLAAQLKGTMNQQELVALLASKGGATQREIADVLRTTPATINTMVQRLKKKTKAKKKS